MESQAHWFKFPARHSKDDIVELLRVLTFQLTIGKHQHHGIPHFLGTPEVVYGMQWVSQHLDMVTRLPNVLFSGETSRPLQSHNTINTYARGPIHCNPVKY